MSGFMSIFDLECLFSIGPMKKEMTKCWLMMNRPIGKTGIKYVGYSKMKILNSSFWWSIAKKNSKDFEICGYGMTRILSIKTNQLEWKIRLYFVHWIEW